MGWREGGKRKRPMMPEISRGTEDKRLEKKDERIVQGKKVDCAQPPARSKEDADELQKERSSTAATTKFAHKIT